jgi:hypothetical protein
MVDLSLEAFQKQVSVYYSDNFVFIDFWLDETDDDVTQVIFPWDEVKSLVYQPSTGVSLELYDYTDEFFFPKAKLKYLYSPANKY